MRFELPWCWIVLPAVLAYLAWLTWRSYAQLIPAARWGSLALRCVILVLLVGALSRPAFLSRHNHHHLVFVVDASRSVSRDNLDAALADMDRLAREAAGQHGDMRFSVVAFGRRPELLVRSETQWSSLKPDVREKILHESTLPDLYAQRTRLISESKAGESAALDALTQRINAIEKFRDEVVGDHTDVERAVRLAQSCGSTAERRTLYVFTDGNFNRGEWQRAWSTDVSASTRINTIALNRPMPPEVALADVALPQAVRINQGFSADIRVASTVETPARLIVFRDGFSVHESDVAIKPGDNTFKVAGLYFREKGFHTIEATIRPQRDTQLKNNTLRSMIVVPGETRVLYVDADESQMPYLKGALELEGMQVEARPAAGVPQAISDLLSFDAFILSNVPADRLSFRQMQMIRTYVQEFGGGFVMLGGQDSFGLGGYFNTPIEEILPVRMPIQKDLTRPSLAIMLVIDKSGSMSGVKIELAKRASLATAEAINPRDLIGVIGFDSESRVLLELTPAADRETIAGHIASLEAGGGTFLYPALEEAHNRLAQTNAQRKHVIVLSDGQTQGFGYEERVGAMAADGITLSAIGIGEDADMKLMEAISIAGGGRSYFTNDFYTIPQIFTREALRASNSMLVERLVQPSAIGSDVCLDGIDTDDLPLLSGYVATTAKPAGSVILASDSGDPLLAKWRCGLGRTAAFTSETKPRWAEDWITWPNFAKFWSQVIRSVTGEDLARTVSVECAHAPCDDGVRLSADVRDAAGNFVTDATLELSAMDEVGRPHPVPVERVGPGLSEARLPEIVYGRDQQFIWRLREGQREPVPVSYGFVYSFSPEFRTLGHSREALDRIAAQHAGDLMSVGESRMVLSNTPAAWWRQLWPLLLSAALLLVPLDILVRRVG